MKINQSQKFQRTKKRKSKEKDNHPFRAIPSWPSGNRMDLISEFDNSIQCYKISSFKQLFKLVKNE